MIRLCGTLLCLLALATSASAESVWVLWSSTWRDAPGWGNPIWGPLETYDTKGKCVAELDKRISNAVATGNVKRWDNGANRNTVIQKGSGLNVMLQCLPDTVDPRGPKGK